MMVIVGYSCPIEEVLVRVQRSYLSFKTRVYILPVTRCQKFGHIAAYCRKERNTCPICASPHKYADKENKKCANCGEPHCTSYRACPKFLASERLMQNAPVIHISY